MPCSWLRIDRKVAVKAKKYVNQRKFAVGKAKEIRAEESSDSRGET